MINVGCFALVDPFRSLDAQLARIASWGFRHADITDNADGACLGAEFGFTALASLDANPMDIQRLFTKHGLTISSFCAHANLLDPSAPWRYGTAQIMKAVRAAATLGIRHVITTEGEPTTDFGHRLTGDQAILLTCEKLYEPLRLAHDLGVKILLEPHGPLTDSVDMLERVLNTCQSSALGINLDTGNLWLGGGEPLELIARLGKHIEHVHWKDMPASMIPERGRRFGCGMASIALGTGVVGIREIFQALEKQGFQGHTTLEIAGEAAVKASYAYLRELGAQ